jgi:nicotinamide phosphoribosyltransferase
MKIRPLTQLDFYKTQHKDQYPEGTTLVYSNLTPRSVKYLPKIEGTDDKIVFFGLQYFIKDFLVETFNREFFNKPKDEVVSYYKRRLDTSLGGDADVSHIEDLHNLGYLPILIKALPEGSAIKEKIPVFTIENTLPEFFWLTNFLETILSATIWKPCTSATIARKYKKLLLNFAEETGADASFVPFQGHDFSFRGMSGAEDAAMTGAGHLTSFVGTDTVPAIDFLEDYYNADASKELIGCSVPATEHSVMTLNAKFGEGEPDEYDSFKRLITQLYPKGIVSIVSDSFDFWGVLTKILPSLKSEIMARDGKVVIRPDSGDPVKIVAGYKVAPYSEEDIVVKDDEKEYYDAFEDAEGNIRETSTGKILESHVIKGAVETLWETFGGTTTEKGFKVLDSHIGIIYGDSITLERAKEILTRLRNKGFASNNIVFGIGSYTYQYQTRDCLGFAVKATAGIVNGEVKEIFKKPKTDDGMKNSAKGFLGVYQENGEYFLVDKIEKDTPSLLTPVFQDGKILRESSLSEIRERINQSL